MEQTPHIRTEEFTDQFTVLLSEHWPEIIQVLNQQSPRIASLLNLSSPSGMQRISGGWLVQVKPGRLSHPERLRQPRDNEMVGHAIRSWARTRAHLNLPHITISFGT
jgi:hypothetical protein